MIEVDAEHCINVIDDTTVGVIDRETYEKQVSRHLQVEIAYK